MEVCRLKFFSDKAMTNMDLLNCACELNIPHFRGVYMRDNLPKKLFKTECRLMNLNTQSQVGSHWVAYVKNDSRRKL